jgi:hypothetical protein
MLSTELEKKLAFDLRASWQARVLLGSQEKMHRIVMSVLAHNFPEAMTTLLCIAYPGFTSIQAPFYCTAAKISKAGRVVADLVQRDGAIVKDAEVFMGEMVMQHEFRWLADRLKLNDADRIELFKCAQRWVVADRRLDPNFDPKDPDARRLH